MKEKENKWKRVCDVLSAWNLVILEWQKGENLTVEIFFNYDTICYQNGPEYMDEHTLSSVMTTISIKFPDGDFK